MTLLKKLQAMDVRIVYIVVGTTLRMSKIFAASYKSKILHGKGYGWLTGWVHEDSLRDSTGSPDPDAVKGAEGVIGAREAVGSSTVNEVRAKFEERFQQVATPVGCTNANAGYCDVDGIAGGEPAGNSPISADTMLLLARAMHKDGKYMDASFRSSPSQICTLHHDESRIDLTCCVRIC